MEDYPEPELLSFDSEKEENYDKATANNTD